MELKNLLAQIDLNLSAHSVNQQNLDQGLATVTVQRLVTDSRACVSGDLFIGMTGTNVDGGKFAPKAISQGALGRWFQRLPMSIYNKSVTKLIVIQRSFSGSS